MKRILLTIPALVVLLGLAGCHGILETDPPTPAGGTGFVNLQLATLARTLLPETFAFAEAELTFTPVGADDRTEVVIPRGSNWGSHELRTGNWDLEMRLFLNVGDAEPTASGSSEGFFVTPGVTPTNVTVLLEFTIPQMAGTGTLAWAIVNETDLAQLDQRPNQLAI
ncbi:MAG: hypothetical protein FWD88_07730, partial [Treponema sp.]|nr:hypothetical protein [Treponema sp.]